VSTAIRRSLPFVAGLIALSLASCKGGFKYDGIWTGSRKLTLPGQDQMMATTLGRVTLSITENRFKLSEASIPTEGRIDYRGDHIELTTDTLIEHPLAGPEVAAQHPTIVVTPQPDGTLLFDNPKSIDGKTVFLVRASSAYKQ
jgi:hypothetical protein